MFNLCLTWPQAKQISNPYTASILSNEQSSAYEHQRH